MESVKPLYSSKNLDDALIEFEKLKTEIGQKYPKVITLLEYNESLFSFYNFPQTIRRSIYTTNLVEALNKQLKRQTKKKEQFPNEASLDRFVCDIFINFNQKLGSRIHIGFGAVTRELNTIFEERYS